MVPCNHGDGKDDGETPEKIASKEDAFGREFILVMKNISGDDNEPDLFLIFLRFQKGIEDLKDLFVFMKTMIEPDVDIRDVIDRIKNNCRRFHE